MNLDLTNVAVFGEELRDRLLKTRPPLLKGRWQLFRSFPNTFIGSEVVEFMVSDLATPKDEDFEKTGNNINEQEGAATASAGEVTTDSENVMRILQTLTDFGIIHTVYGNNATGTFKNDSSYYRFTADDGSCSGLVEALTKGRRVHQLTLCPNCALLQRVCEYGKFISDKCMRGSELITWIFENRLASQRDDTLRLCKLMFEHGILKSVSSEVSEFIDGRPFYLFGIDYTAPTLSTRRFLSLLDSDEPLIVSNTSKYVNNEKPQHGRQSSGQLLDLSSQATARSRARRKNTSSSSLASDDSGYNDLSLSSSLASSYTTTTTPPSYESLLKSDGKLSPEALRHPDAPFIKKELRIFPDKVGYGFIIRGGAPCYVKIVDPDSPAGKKGLRAWQYIVEVNDRDVTRKSHTEIEDLILGGPKNLLLCLMVPKDEVVYAHVREINQNNKSAQSDAQFPKPHGKAAPRRQSMPITPKAPKLPSAQPWMKQHRKGSDFGVLMQKPGLKYVH